MEQVFDVIIVGAGPAGCELARQLAKLKYSVLLADRVKSFSQNNFSSAGAPIGILNEFSLPESVVAAKWNKITLISTSTRKEWSNPEDIGVVMEFSKLKEFLSQDAVSNGTVFKMGYEYKSYSELADKTLQVIFKDVDTNLEVPVKGKIVVDATGATRAIMDAYNDYSKGYITGIGLEYIIVTDKYLEPKNLQFFLGFKYTPHGYGWIFPMGERRYKVGVGWLPTFLKEPLVAKTYIDVILHEYMHLVEGDYSIAEEHGGPLIFSKNRTDTYQKGRVIGIGDVISTVSPLGGEGIRYAMRSASLAVKHVIAALDSGVYVFKKYESEAKAHLRFRYRIAQRLSTLVYGDLSDRNIDRGVEVASRFILNDLMAVLFENHYEKMVLPVLPYLYHKLDDLLNKDL